ncbi:MAG: c-type cytochrome domain-containing protein [Verrucomicrobiota bacterium]
MKHIGFILGLVAASTVLSAADVDVSKLPPASAKKDLTFEKDILPIFQKSCVKCHGPEKQKAKLRLDTLEATLKGGENGDCISKGTSAKSTLVHTIARLDPDAAMPPDGKGDPLTKEQVGIVRAWIDQGAK